MQNPLVMDRCTSTGRRAAPARFGALALLGALGLLAQCAPPHARLELLAPAPCTAPPERHASPPLELELAPDPSLQRLIDPRLAPEGPSWLGGDVATSLRVAPDRWIWLFGDTLFGRVSDRCARGRSYCDRAMASPDPWANLVPNSVGVASRSPAGRFSPIVKYWRVEAGRPAPIFAAASPDELLWPLAGRRIGGVLLIAASRHTRASGLYPIGNAFVRVANPDAPPDSWRYTLHDVPNVRAGPGEPDPLTWTTAMVEQGTYLYVLGERGVGLRARAVLCRLPAAGLDGPGWKPEPEYLLDAAPGHGAVWSRGFRLEALHEVEGLPGTSEATVEWLDGFGWTTFQIRPFSFEVRAFTARELAGPWSDRGVVYSVPVPWSVLPREECLSPEAGCGQDRYAAYAVKSHRELAPPGGFALSYNLNLHSGSLERAERSVEELDDFYVPQMIAGTPAPMR